ncbi:GtrA family protein [Sphingomicrobium astaxanthinifaciens]|uniref:GtrA family protein n=1 Tax=Sphingomicrobium astaxanthinifaciens TaxID=1227949 RepID=UPI001FCBDADE|nr:GtrA family protein [Sphingomicrobium astaxanthinifaciens]MCJ7421300.1 GtrA family protein [Sphingomicrobium astaxanthinifaciens]
MRQTWEGLDPERRTVLVQLARYAATGFGITIAVALAYWVVAHFIDPNLSLLLVFIVFNFISYALHGRISFKDHGGRDNPARRNLRFALVNVGGLVVNQFWVWLLVKQLGGPTWWPTLAFVFVTPWLTFALHRKWVYA